MRREGCNTAWAASCIKMNKPNCRLPTHKMANGKNHGNQATKAMDAPITAQQWATQAKPRQLERRLRRAHSWWLKKSSGLTRGAAAMFVDMNIHFASHTSQVQRSANRP
jgi:hypothetical protein